MATKAFCGYVHEEVVEQILLRLPCTKSILTCTLVCKSWYSLIKSSHFINTHLSRPDNTKHLLCKTFSYRQGKSVYKLYSDSETSDNCVTLVFPNGLKNVKVHGCCNGVICYTKRHGNRRKIYLWNPTVRKLKVLPQFRKFYDYKDVKETIGFWFDEEKSDYEVVKITYTSLTSSVDVYSLSSNSWKIISDTCPGAPFSIVEDNLVYAKGTLHWLAVERQCWRIVSLDMNSAKFREALISTRCFQKDVLYLRGVDANSLVILRKNGLCCVCIIKVHDESLELLYSDSDESLNDDYFLVGYRNNGEALLLLQKDTLFELPENLIISYKFDDKQSTDFYFLCSDIFLSARPFVETLVLLNESDVSIDVFGLKIGKRMVGSLKNLFKKIFLERNSLFHL